MLQFADALLEGLSAESEDLGVFVLPPALDEEMVDEDDTRLDSEGHTSKIFNCCY